jgi:hypothetical protein
MRVSRRYRWWGLYALIPLMIGLMVLDAVAPMTETEHRVLLTAIALVTCGLALAWIERNARCVETDGLDVLSTYRVLLDTAAGPSAEPVVREAPLARDTLPAAERDTAVRSPAGQTMPEGARVLS